MGEELVVDEARDDVAVLVVEDERAVRVVDDQAQRGPHVAAQIERLEREPVAAALRRVEPIDRKAGAALRARRASTPRPNVTAPTTNAARAVGT